MPWPRWACATASRQRAISKRASLSRATPSDDRATDSAAVGSPTRSKARAQSRRIVIGSSSAGPKCVDHADQPLGFDHRLCCVSGVEQQLDAGDLAVERHLPRVMHREARRSRVEQAARLDVLALPQREPALQPLDVAHEHVVSAGADRPSGVSDDRGRRGNLTLVGKEERRVDADDRGLGHVARRRDDLGRAFVEVAGIDPASFVVGREPAVDEGVAEPLSIVDLLEEADRFFAVVAGKPVCEHAVRDLEVQAREPRSCLSLVCRASASARSAHRRLSRLRPW